MVFRHHLSGEEKRKQRRRRRREREKVRCPGDWTEKTGHFDGWNRFLEREKRLKR